MTNSSERAPMPRDYRARKSSKSIIGVILTSGFFISSFRCTLRFPSTNIRIQFENLVDQNNRKQDGPGGKSTSVENTNTVYRPLKISIPEQEGALKNIKSPFPSPTGTMSAANSCPTSPRHNNYHDFYSQHNNGNSSHNFNDMVRALAALHDARLIPSRPYRNSLPLRRRAPVQSWKNLRTAMLN
jgi:hypothetical protein